MSKLTLVSPRVLKTSGMVAAIAAGIWLTGCGHDHDDRDRAEHAGYYQDHGTYQDVNRDRDHESAYNHDRDRD